MRSKRRTRRSSRLGLRHPCNIPGPETGGPRTLTFEGKSRWTKCVRVGCFSPNDQTYFHGDISEILVYTRRLTDAGKNRLAVYLMGKWEL